MARSVEQSDNTNGRKLLLEELRQEQEQYSEGSGQWAKLQETINRVIAQNFLEYINR